MKNRLVILDRDGVINHDSSGYIKRPQEWHALPGSLAAIAKLCRAGYRVAVITNQSGIAKGLYDVDTLNQIHRKMKDELQACGGEISAIFFCPHDDADNCECRKPKPGMFLELARGIQCDLGEVFAVGDSMRDLVAAHAAGAKPVLVETGNGRETARELANPAQENPAQANLQLGEMSPKVPPKIPVFDDLAAFVNHLTAK